MDIKPMKPMAPTPPPGGNIENRQPPAEPSAPKKEGSKGSSDNEALATTVSSILEDYDANNLSQEDALAISQAFQDAGIAPTHALKEAIEATGFNADNIRSLTIQASEQMPQMPQLTKAEEENFSTLLASLFENDETSSNEYSSRLSQLNQQALSTLSSILENVSKTSENSSKVAVNDLFMREESYLKTSFYA